jgi:GNAT superfamily N-acetyltransferase
MAGSVLDNGFYDVPPGKIAAVVTHLEMRAPAALRPRAAPEGVTLERIKAPDVTWYRDIYNRVGAQDWLWFSRLKLSDTALGTVIGDPLVEIYALVRDGRAEGLQELDFRQPGACELAHFGVTKALIGTTASRFAMNQAITRAWEKPIQRFHVHTCTLDHPAAVSFYIRSGFTPIRQQIEIDDDPRVTGSSPRDAGPHVPIFDRDESQ